jgi:hypothetical protein
VEAVVALVAFLLLMIPGGLIFWAMYRSTTLTQRLHPLTPKQRRAKRRAYAILVSLGAATLALELVLQRSGVVVLVAVFGHTARRRTADALAPLSAGQASVLRAPGRYAPSSSTAVVARGSREGAA